MRQHNFSIREVFPDSGYSSQVQRPPEKTKKPPVIPPEEDWVILNDTKMNNNFNQLFPNLYEKTKQDFIKAFEDTKSAFCNKHAISISENTFFNTAMNNIKSLVNDGSPEEKCERRRPPEGTFLQMLYMVLQSPDGSSNPDSFKAMLMEKLFSPGASRPENILLLLNKLGTAKMIGDIEEIQGEALQRLVSKDEDTEGVALDNLS